MSGYSKTVIVSPFPYYSGVLNAPQSTGAGNVGIWYAYFESTSLPNDGVPKVISIAGIGTSGNASLFESLTDGVKFKSNVIIQATAWGLVDVEQQENKWLGIQLDKQGTLLVRAYTTFSQRAANITYGGVLVPDDILRVVAANSGNPDNVTEGWISVIASPI
jgi:hypothetical protein